MTDIPRVRMFAGPNGSGKSSLKELLPTGQTLEVKTDTIPLWFKRAVWDKI